MTWWLTWTIAIQDESRVREELHQILQRPEFREHLPSDFWAKLREKLTVRGTKGNEKWKPPKPPDIPSTRNFGSGSAGGFSVLPWVLFSLVAAFVIFILFKMLLERRREEPSKLPPASQTSDAQTATLNALTQSPHQWLRDAESLFRQGRSAEAIRSLFLAVLSFAHSRDWIDYRPFKTNGEYVRKFAGPNDGRIRLDRLTDIFELIWYGRREVSQKDFQESKVLVSEILQMGGSPP